MIAITKEDFHMLKHLLTEKRWYELDQSILSTDLKSVQIDESNLSNELWKKLLKLFSLGIIKPP